MYIEERKDLFRKRGTRSNPFRVLVLLLLIVGFVAVLRAYGQGEIWPPFLPTPTPTRTVNSFLIEGQTHYQAGNLDAAMTAFRRATELEPNNVEILVELARIQVYSSASLTTDAQKTQRLTEAQATIEAAKAINPDNSMVQAISSFVYGWSSDSIIFPNTWEANQGIAETSALRAIQLDQRNPLAYTFYTETLIDQYKLPQAVLNMETAVQLGPQEMDVWRVQGLLNEYLAEYNLSIESYVKAIEINPNLTFLYIRLGHMYRHLNFWDEALESYAKAANLNRQLGIEDPIPYIAIANTYLRMPEASPMVAARNAYRALEMSPYNPDTYGQVGFVYYKARNYEGAIWALRCAVQGCTDAVSCEAREVCGDPNHEQIQIEALPLTVNTEHYYYTYGSVLAGLNRPGVELPEENFDYCVEARKVFQLLRDKFPDHENTMGIVAAGEAICSGSN